MAGPFHKEMGTYLEVRKKDKTKGHLAYHLGFKRRVRRTYKKAIDMLVRYCETFWQLFFPKLKIKEDISANNVHVFDREKSPAVVFVRKIFTKPHVERDQVEEEDVDIALVEKTIKEGKL